VKISFSDGVMYMFQLFFFSSLVALELVNDFLLIMPTSRDDCAMLTVVYYGNNRGIMHSYCLFVGLLVYVC